MILHCLYWLGFKFSSKFLLNLLAWKKNETPLITYLKSNELLFSITYVISIFLYYKHFPKTIQKNFNFKLILWIDVAVLNNFKGSHIVTTNRFQLETLCTQSELPFLLRDNGILPLWHSKPTAFSKVSEFKCTCDHWNLQSQVQHCNSFIKNQMAHLGSKTKPEKLLSL